jgi:hypothetical protein
MDVILKSAECGVRSAEKYTTKLSRVVLWLLVLVGLVQCVTLVSLQARGWPVLHGNDFKHLWAGSRLLAVGRDPYDPVQLLRAAEVYRLGGINPFVYLPTTGMLMWPLGQMAFALAQYAWFILNTALAWSLVLAGPSWLRLKRPDLARLAGAAFLVGSMPFYRQMTAGQLNVVLASLFLWGAVALQRGRQAQLGLSVALGFGFKITPILLVPALWLMGRRKAAAWAMAGSFALIGLSILAFGWPVHQASLPVLREMSYGRSTWAQFGMEFYCDPFNQSFNSLFHHLVTENPRTRPWFHGSPSLANALTWLASLAVAAGWILAWTRWRRSHGQKFTEAETHLYLAAAIATMLIPSLLWDHYAVQALAALLVLSGSGWPVRNWKNFALAAIGFTFLCAPIPHPALNHGAGILLMHARLWPLLSVWSWLLVKNYTK